MNNYERTKEARQLTSKSNNTTSMKSIKNMVEQTPDEPTAPTQVHPGGAVGSSQLRDSLATTDAAMLQARATDAVVATTAAAATEQPMAAAQPTQQQRVLVAGNLKLSDAAPSPNIILFWLAFYTVLALFVGLLPFYILYKIIVYRK